MAGEGTGSAGRLVEERPGAGSATSPAEFVAAMRELKCYSGLSCRQLETRAARDGRVLPRSTLVNVLHRETLPREDLVTAFARACGCGDEEVAGWVVVRRRLATAATRARPAAAGRAAGRPVPAPVVVLVVAAVLALTAVLTVVLAGVVAG
jgi:hypothetical protein